LKISMKKSNVNQSLASSTQQAIHQDNLKILKIFLVNHENLKNSHKILKM
jgi:hypothetical protein